MLSPTEFSVGSLMDAGALTLLLPRTKHEQSFLISQSEGHHVAVFLGDEHRFESFRCDKAENWKGLIIPSVTVEVDECSIFDADNGRLPKGTLLREKERLSLAALGRDSHGFKDEVLVPLVEGLQANREHCRAGFWKWRIVLGEGREKRILKIIEVESQI